MGCKRATMKVIKGIANTIKPGLLRYAVDTATRLQDAAAQDPLWLTRARKRRMLVAEIRAEWKRTAREGETALARRVVNLVAELAVNAAKNADVPNEEFIPDASDDGEIVLP